MQPWSGCPKVPLPPRLLAPPSPFPSFPPPPVPSAPTKPSLPQTHATFTLLPTATAVAAAAAAADTATAARSPDGQRAGADSGKHGATADTTQTLPIYRNTHDIQRRRKKEKGEGKAKRKKRTIRTKNQNKGEAKSTISTIIYADFHSFFTQGSRVKPCSASGPMDSYSISGSLTRAGLIKYIFFYYS